ncbi:acyl-CoA reductase [Lacibacter sp. H375]|uniref:acyl-CoA reductase n=1 Tax=Lacibacter sp. H375 TaxID=3133424 RepID=UPI0030BC3C89
MNLQQRLEILYQLRQYISEQPTEWQNACRQAEQLNNWFTQRFIQTAAEAVADNFLNNDLLRNWADHYHLDDNIIPKTVGIVMAGNIPLVGFHDFLCVFVSGHKQVCKLSSKDDVLLKHLVTKMTEWNPAVAERVQFNSMLKDCDAYIATGSDNSARYFDYYFGRYPSIIRKNRTSVAILTGSETETELSLLADDIMQYFGLGCRNITKLYVSTGYDFVPLLNALRKYSWMFDHHKYRNNYDYQLAIYLMNNIYYMTNDCIVLIENEQVFSPIGTLHYSYYEQQADVINSLKRNEQVQAIVGKDFLPFGEAQQPGLMDYADGIDVMAFLLSL